MPTLTKVQDLIYNFGSAVRADCQDVALGYSLSSL